MPPARTRRAGRPDGSSSELWAEGKVDTLVVHVVAAVPGRVVALGLNVQAPARFAVSTVAGTVQAPRTGEQTDLQAHSPFMRCRHRRRRRPTYRCRSPALWRPRTTATPTCSLEGPGDPVARVFRPVADPAAFRYEQRFSPDHPSWIGYRAVRAWPVAWAVRAALPVVSGALAAAHSGDGPRVRVPGPEDAPGLGSGRWRICS